MWLLPSQTEAWITCSACAFMFVASIYVWGGKWAFISRDDPRVIARRLLSVSVVCAISPIVFFLFARYSPMSDRDESKVRELGLFPSYLPQGPSFLAWLGLRASGLLSALFLPLLLFLILFLGPMYLLVVEKQAEAEMENQKHALSIRPSIALISNTPTFHLLQPTRWFADAYALLTERLSSSIELITHSFHHDHFLKVTSPPSTTNNTNGTTSSRGVQPSSATPPPSSTESAVVLLQQRAYVAESSLIHQRVSHEGIKRIRTLIVAPILEELLFRAIICTLLRSAGVSSWATVILSPTLFGLAHVHHFYNHTRAHNMKPIKAIVTIVIQLCYTILFGALASYVYLRTGHLISAIIVHCFCNLMGLPDFSLLTDPTHPQAPHRSKVIAAFVVGLVAFLFLAHPLTDPSLYGGVSFWS